MAELIIRHYPGEIISRHQEVSIFCGRLENQDYRHEFLDAMDETGKSVATLAVRSLIRYSLKITETGFKADGVQINSRDEPVLVDGQPRFSYWEVNLIDPA